MLKRSEPPEAKVEITPMLDMSFNLLAFFVMTFNPSPMEGEFALNLLPATPQTQAEAAPSESESTSELPAALRTLTVILSATPGGDLDHMALEQLELRDLPDLRARLEALLADESLPFDQALIQADPNLKYEVLIAVVDIFAEQGITKISFGEALDELGRPRL